MPLKNIENSQVYNTVTNQLLVSQSVNSFQDALENAAGVGEHNDVLETMDLEIAKIAEAEDKLNIVLKHLKVSNPRI